MEGSEVKARLFDSPGNFASKRRGKEREKKPSKMGRMRDRRVGGFILSSSIL